MKLPSVYSIPSPCQIWAHDGVALSENIFLPAPCTKHANGISIYTGSRCPKEPPPQDGIFTSKNKVEIMTYIIHDDRVSFISH